MATSARYNAIKAQLQQQGGAAKQSSGQTRRSDQYEAIRAKLKQNRFVTDVDADYINSFVRDAKEFAQNAEQEYKNLNYQTAASPGAQSKRRAAMEDLTIRAGRVRTYLNANRSQLSSDSYNEAISFLDSFQDFQTENLNAFRNAEAYFSRWESEDAYNSFVAEQAKYQKEYQEKLNANTYALTGELSALLALKDEYDALNKKVTTLAPSQSDYAYERMSQISQQYGDLDTLIAEKKAYLSDAEWIQKIAGLADAEDFAEKSKYVPTANGQERSWADILLGHYDPTRSGWDDPLYEYINGNEEAGAFISNQAAENYSEAGGLGAIFGRSTDSRTESQRMTKDEVAIFNYLYATEGKQVAHDYYYNFLRSDLHSRQRAYDQKYWADYAKDDPFGSSVFSVVTSPLKGLAYIGQAGDYIAGGKVDQNAGYNQFSYANSAIRDQVAKQIEESGKWGKAGSFLYQTGMSMGDFVMSTAVSGGNQALALAIMGTGAAADTTIAAKDRGLTDDQAFALGTVAGAAEILMEKIGLDALFDTKLLKGNGIKYILKNALAEGGEEVGTDLINTMADVLIAQDKSQWQMVMDAYVAEGKSEKEAFGLALADKALELGLSGLGGMLSGGVLGGVGTFVNGVQNKVQSDAQAVTDYGGSQADLVAEALDLNPGNTFALKMKSILDSGKNLSGSQLNKLVQMNEAAIKKGEPGSEAAQQAQGGEIPGSGNLNVANNTALRNPALPSEGEAAPDNTQQNQTPTFQEEVQRQFERTNGYEKAAPKIYDIDEVFSAVKSAHSSGAITEERYSDIVDTLAFAQSDYAEGNISEEEYQGMLETAMRRATQQSGVQMAAGVSATDPMVDVGRQTWQQAQRLAKALGRDIVFYNGVRGENGYYKDGTIYVNILADDPFAQVVSHELTHSLEGSKHYDRLKRFVFAQMARMNVDLAQARKAKANQYKSHGKELRGEAEIDAEIVAEYVQTHLLTDEQAIMDLVAAERNVAKRILDWLRNFARRIVGNQSSQERARLEHATRIYAKALQESRNGRTGSGTVSLRNQGVSGDQPQSGDLRQSREQTEADYREGRITDAEFDAAMDEYDRADEDRLGRSLEKYSVGKANRNVAKNTKKKYNKKHAKVYFAENVFPSYKVSQSEAHELAERWSRAEGAQPGECRLISFHGEWYRIQAFDDMDYGYQIMEKVAAKDYDKEVKRYGVIDGNGLVQRGARKIVTRHRGSDSNGDAGHRADYDGPGYRRENSTVRRVGREQAGRGQFEYDSQGNREGGRLDRTGEDGSAVTPETQTGEEKFSFGGSGIFIGQDATYMDAVNRGDMTTAQRLVDEAAKAAGYTVKAYHGTSNDFWEFKKGHKRTRGSLNFGDGFYFAPSRSSAENYTNTGRVIEGYLKLKKPYTIYGTRLDSSDFARISSETGTDVTIENVTEVLKTHGYDGIIARNYNGTTNPVNQYVVFDSNQVKSANPITYDDDGNVIPLSERFNEEKSDIRYSLSDKLTEEQDRRPMEGSYTTDEVEMQARKKGYPVLHGEQIVPFRTWVRTIDRGNYGLVTGMAPENKLLVSFHNKHDGGTADNVPIAYDNLVPVPGTYQMTKEEFASLMESEPMDPGSNQLSEEDMREIEELYNQARGNEEKQTSPIDLEMLPKKAQNYLSRAKRTLLRNLRKKLGIPQAAMQEHLQEIVDEITAEYLNSGTVSDEKLAEFFDKAYAQGILTDREFYDQYKHIKDYLRTTAVTLSERDRADIADFNDFRKRQFGRLRIVNQGGLPVDTAYDELRSMAPELFPEDIAHPADQLVHMAEVARSIEISKRALDEFAGPERETYRTWARHDFDEAVGEIMGDLYAVRRFADERAAAAARETAPATPEEAMEAYKKLKKARRLYERVAAKNLLTQHDEAQVGRLLRHEIELEHLNPEKDNVKGITAVYEAKVEYERLCKLITEYKRHLHGKLRTQADQYLKTANDWKDKKVGIAYARETMRRNIYDIVSDRTLASEINEVYFEPVHDAEAKAVHLKDEYRNKVREMNLSRKVAKGNLVSEAHAVQLLGEAMDNIRILENTKGRMQHRDGKTLADWRGVVMKLWDENPNLDQEKIRGAVQQFRQIYDNLFEQMNKVRVENGYEPINYRSGYFPHFQPGEADGILAQFGRALGIDTQVVALPTTIAGLTHTFKPGIQWFGNAQERLGFNTAYDAVEGFDKYIEGAASVIFQTENIQRLRAFATQVRYRTSNEGIQDQVDAVYEDSRLTDEEKQVKIASIYEHGKFALANFVAELDEYTNLLANKKSKYDRTIESLMGRKSYAFLKWWESRVGANMIAGNLSSALTNFIPLTQAGAQMDRFAILNGMWKTLGSYSTDDGLRGMSSFLTNRKGSDPLVRNWSQVVSGKLSLPMEIIDQFVSGSIVRGSYYQNLKRGMSESEAMHQADIFAAGVIADRSKGSMPTLMQASNPLFKMFTQFQLEVNNQFSEVFKDLPRNHRQQGILHFALVLFKYFLGALLFNELYEWLVGRRPALDPIGLLIDAGKDFADPDVGFGEGMKNLGTNILSELPFSSGLTLLGIETDGGRIPASSAVPDLTAIWDAATDEDMHWKKRLKEIGDEVSKPLTYVIPPFGGNQISKIWKGAKAFIEGGSYSVDAEGNDILQYPVYNDDPWSALGSLFRATLLGKSSLPEAQEWLENGFDSLGARETVVYQDMLDGGVSQKEAFELIQELGAARGTDSLTEDEVKRSILQKSEVAGEGKAIAYYGLLASDAERELMDKLADMDADPWEVATTLMAIKDARNLDGSEKTNAKYDAIIQATLTDEEKTVLVGSVIGTDLETENGNLTQYAKFKIAIEGGMSVDEYLKFRKAGGDIDDYLDFSNAGLGTDDAVEISLALDELVPLDGKERVSEIQQWRTCVDTFSHTASQLAALAGVMTEKQYAKVDIAYDYNVSPALYVSLRETLVKYDANGNGSLSNTEVTDAINSMRGLSKKQKAVLWQLTVSSKSAKNNPYSPEIGELVLDELNKG